MTWTVTKDAKFVGGGRSSSLQFEATNPFPGAMEKRSFTTDPGITITNDAGVDVFLNEFVYNGDGSGTTHPPVIDVGFCTKTFNYPAPIVVTQLKEDCGRVKLLALRRSLNKRLKVTAAQTVLQNKDPPTGSGRRYTQPVETAPIPSPQARRKADFEQRRREGQALEKAWGEDESGRTIPRRTTRHLMSATGDESSDAEDAKSQSSTSSLRSWFGKSSRNE